MTPPLCRLGWFTPGVSNPGQPDDQWISTYWRALLAQFDIRAAASGIESLIRAANTYIQQHRPWELAAEASSESKAVFDHTIGTLVISASTIAELLQIFTPGLAARALTRLEQGTSGIIQPRLKAQTN